MKTKITKDIFIIIAISLLYSSILAIWSSINSNLDIPSILLVFLGFIAPFVLPILSIRKFEDEDDSMYRVLTYIIKFIFSGFSFAMMCLGGQSIILAYSNSALKTFGTFVGGFFTVLGVTCAYYTYQMKPLYKKVASKPKEEVKQELKATPEVKETVKQDAKTTLDKQESIKAVIKSIEKISNATIIHCEGCNAPIIFTGNGVKECEYCGRLTEYKVKKVETPKRQVEDKYKGNEYSSRYKENYKRQNKVNEYAYQYKPVKQVRSKNNDVDPFWFFMGVLTAILMFPFTFMESWNRTQRRKGRRRRY